MDKFAFAPVIPLVIAGAAVLFACSAGTDAAGTGGTQTFGSGVVAGTCMPMSNLATRSLGVGCSATYGGSANVVEGSVTVPLLGTKIAIDLGNSGLVAAAGGTKSDAVAAVNVSGYVTGSNGLSTAVGTDGQTAAESSLKNLDIGIAGLNVSASVVGSQAIASCGSAATATSTITGLTIAGQSITVTGAANQKVTSGLLTVIINEQVPTTNGIQVNALHVSALGILDVTVGGSLASILCACPSTDAGTGVGVGVGVGVDAGGVGVGLDAGVGTSSGSVSSGGVIVIGGGGSTSSSTGGVTISLDAGVTLPTPPTSSGDAGTTAPSTSSSGAVAADAGTAITTQPSTSSSSGDVNANADIAANADSTAGAGSLGATCDTSNPCAAGYSCASAVK